MALVIGTIINGEIRTKSELAIIPQKETVTLCREDLIAGSLPFTIDDVCLDCRVR
jgi:hypothetical protein